ncbi:MAG: ribonuclease III [Anaeromyxobacter sp.]|nr:ribonuclease III [Anaeromyxobacter sp.]
MADDPQAPQAPDEQALVAALEARLGQPLRDRATALAALTHKSFVNEQRGPVAADNERLEFLGDAVIDLAVSHRLMERFPAAREGDLSKMRAAVVDEQGLAALATALDLGPLLRLGRGEERTGGRRKASLLADAMEAVVAAIYLSDGLPGVLSLVDRCLGEAFQRAAEGTLDRDFKTQLQEVAQSRLKVAPRYQVVAELGPDHAKVFEVELDLRGEVLGRATGRSKKDAEQAVARLGLEVLLAKLTAAADATAAPPHPGPLPQQAAGEGEQRTVNVAPPHPGALPQQAAGEGANSGASALSPAPPSPPSMAPALPLPSGERAGVRGERQAPANPAAAPPPPEQVEGEGEPRSPTAAPRRVRKKAAGAATPRHRATSRPAKRRPKAR